MRISIAFILLILLVSACSLPGTWAPAADLAPTIQPESQVTNAICTVQAVSAAPTGWACPQRVSAAWAGAGAGDPDSPLWGNGGYDVLHYLIDLQVDIENNIVSGETTLEAVATQSFDAFNLDFLGMKISRLLVNGTEAEYCRNDAGELTIIPAMSLLRGETFTVSVAYSGTPELLKSDDLSFWGWFKVDDGVFTAGVPNDPAYLYPNNEYWSDLATYTLRVTVPDTYQVSTVGLLDETIVGDGTVTTVWRQDKPVSANALLLSIDRNTSVQTLAGPDGLPVRLYYPTENELLYQPMFQSLPEMVAFFSNYLGPYPYDGLGLALVRNFPVEMAVPTLIVLKESGSQWLLPHELAHQWFGGSLYVTDYRDGWLAEGFATYAEVLWAEHQGGESADVLISRRYRMLPSRTAPPGSASKDHFELGGDVFYNRPGVAFHALRLHTGDETFFRILKTFTSRYRYSMVTTEDFIAVAEEVSGQELDDFFDAWLYQEAVPDIPGLNLSKGNGT